MIGLANGPDVLAVLRLCAGIGLGAAFPNVAALAAEFTPARRRSLAVVITIVCVPLGGVIGGTAASFIMPLLGWRSLFVGAGLVTLAICGIIVLALPESVRFLARSPHNIGRVSAILRRMGISPSDILPLPMSKGTASAEMPHFQDQSWQRV
jgi:AAHS family 4-hydroxybenzoate transporter-like MFS transporter